jgi:hypothetical protein
VKLFLEDPFVNEAAEVVQNVILMGMRRVVFAALLSSYCITLAQPQDSKLVSLAFGNKVELHEREIAGILIFTLTNQMPSAVQQYLIETWGTYEHGPPRRLCSIDVNNTEITPHSIARQMNVCTLASDPLLGKPLSHASMIVAVGLANGWKWHRPVTYKISRSPV